MNHLSRPRYLFGLLATIMMTGPLYATQVIPHPIDPQIGENLWGMNYRQSIAQDDILDTVTLCCNCDFFITQDDIDGNGGGFAITQPGNWCLGENIITTAPITISGMQGVVFDLKGRSISSNVKGPFASIVQITNSPGTVIQNGYIVGQDLGSSLDIRVGISISSSPDSLVSNVRTTFLASVDNPGIIQTSTAFSADSNVEFNTCFATGPFVHGFVLTGDTDTLLNCQVVHFSADLVLTIFSNPGLGYWLQGSNHYVENCKSIGGDAQPTSNSAGSTGFFVPANNSILNNCTAIHHFNTTQTSPGIPAGSGFYVTGNSCEIRNCTSAYNEEFGIFNSGTGLVVCNNSVHDNGTNLSGAPSSDICSLLSAASGCDFIITQADIGSGGVYTITQPGKYCLAETVSYSTGNAITINSDNVVLSLGQHPMLRTVLNTQPSINGAVVCNGRNCIIEDGDINADTIILTATGTTVRNCKSTGNFTQPATITLNAGADDCRILNCEVSATDFNGITSFSNNVLIDSCSIIGASRGIAIFGNQTVVQNCVTSSNLFYGITTDARCFGVDIENCIADFNGASAPSNNGAGILVQGSTDPNAILAVTVNNCKTQLNNGYGIVVGFTNSLLAEYNGLGTYVITSDFGIRVTNCVSRNNTPLGNLIMILTITDPLMIQPTITNTPRLISPQIGIITGPQGATTYDTTVGSIDFLAPIAPSLGSNVS